MRAIKFKYVVYLRFHSNDLGTKLLTLTDVLYHKGVPWAVNTFAAVHLDFVDTRKARKDAARKMGERRAKSILNPLLDTLYGMEFDELTDSVKKEYMELPEILGIKGWSQTLHVTEKKA